MKYDGEAPERVVAGPGLLYVRIEKVGACIERNVPHLVRGDETRTFSRLPHLFHRLVKRQL